MNTMEKLSPTSGRWRVVSPGPTIQNRHDACIEVVTDDYQKAICHVYERRRGQKMPAIPNAWLIAAAPMMFEALEMIEAADTVYDGDELTAAQIEIRKAAKAAGVTPNQYVMKAIRAAIAAAKGGVNERTMNDGTKAHTRPLEMGISR